MASSGPSLPQRTTDGRVKGGEEKWEGEGGGGEKGQRERRVLRRGGKRRRRRRRLMSGTVAIFLD